MIRIIVYTGLLIALLFTTKIFGCISVLVLLWLMDGYSINNKNDINDQKL